MGSDTTQNTSNELLRARLEAIKPDLSAHLDSAIESIRHFDSGIPLFWEQTGLAAKIETYQLRYVSVFLELYENEQPSSLLKAELLGSQLLSCVAWRLLDNCLDGHTEPMQAHLASVMAFGHLLAFAECCTGRKLRPDIEDHYRSMTAAAEVERNAPLDLSSIWKRCSIFFFPGSTLAPLSPESLQVYKDYINYSGLAHDAHDLFSDIEQGVLSLPVVWLKEIDPDHVFSERNVGRLYDRVRSEVDNLERGLLNDRIAAKFPLLCSLAKDSYCALHDGATSNISNTSLR